MRNSGHIFRIVTAFRFLTIIPLPFGAPPRGGQPDRRGPDTGRDTATKGDDTATTTIKGGDTATTIKGGDTATTIKGGDTATTIKGDDTATTIKGDDTATTTIKGDDTATTTIKGDDTATTIEATTIEGTTIAIKGVRPHLFCSLNLATNLNEQNKRGLTPFIVAQAAAFEKEIGASTAWYPLVGVFQGAAVFASCTFLGRIFPAEIAAALALCAVVLSNGGFHLDGLSDTFDALASRKPLQRKLEIMKDSAAGPIGVTAVALVLLVKYLALAYLFKAGYAWLSFTVFSVGKWAVVPAARHGESARKDGLGRVIIENTGAGEVILAGALTVSVMAATAYVFGGGASEFFNTFTLTFAKMLAIMPAVYAFSYLSARFCRAKFGGLTGDTFGAIIELTEAFVLIYFTSGAWI